MEFMKWGVIHVILQIKMKFTNMGSDSKQFTTSNQLIFMHNKKKKNNQRFFIKYLLLSYNLLSALFFNLMKYIMSFYDHYF